MNKWSLLLFSVLGLLLSTTSKLNFVDGRLGCCDNSFRSLSDTRLSIYEPHCAYHTFTDIIQLISPKQGIRYDARNNELNHSSSSDGRRRHFEGRRTSNERFRVSSNVVFNLDDSTISNSRDRQVVRETNYLYLRRNSKSISRDNFRENHVYRSRSRNNEFLGNKMERNSRERRNIDEELSEIRDKNFRLNDGPVSIGDRNQERFNRRSSVIRTYIKPNQRENIDETRNLVEREMKRNNLDLNTKQRLFRNTRLTSELPRSSYRRFKKDEPSTNEYAKVQLASDIGILRNGNIRENLRLSARSDSIVKMYEREILANGRPNIRMDGKIHGVRRSYDDDISDEMVPDSSSLSRTIQRESEGSRNHIRDNKRQTNNNFEKRFFEELYSTRGLPRQNYRHQEIRQAKFYKDINIRDGQDHGNRYVERIERASDQSRNRINRENRHETRLSEEYIAERITPRNINSLVEKRVNINRRIEAIRRSVSDSRDRENYRFRFSNDNENIFEQRRIRQIRKSYNEDGLSESRISQRRLQRSNAIGQEIKDNIMQIYDDDNFFQGSLVREDNNRDRLERERLSRTDKRASQIRIIQRENQNKMHIRAMTIEGNRIQEDPNFNTRLVSTTNRNVETRRTRTYNEKSDNEELRNSYVRETERAFDENRTRQVRDKPEYRRQNRLNVGRTVERVLTRIDHNRNNVVERGFLRIISSIGNNRLYTITRSAVTMFRRPGNYEVRSAHENERILDQRRTRDVLERREDNLSNKRLDQRNLASRNSMNNAGLNNNNRRSYNDENNSQVILVRTTQREMINRSEREKKSSANKRSSYLRINQRDHENRLYIDQKQRTNIQEIRVVEDRRAETPNKMLNSKNMLSSETKRSFDESRVNQLRDNREYSLYDKVNAERVLVRNIDTIIEKRDSRIRSEFANHQNQKTKRTLILLQLREKNVPSLMRLNERDFEQTANGIVRNKQFIKLDHRNNILNAEIHRSRKINVRSNTRGTQDKVITRYVETEVEFHDSHETHHDRRIERGSRNIARHELSRNNRDLLEARSEKRRDVNRKLEYIRYVRSYNGPENNVHRENRDDARVSDRANNRQRNVQDRARTIRASNLQILNKESRITKIRSASEREITAFSKIDFLPMEHKTQSYNQMFEIKLENIIYILQGLYILGLFTKFPENFNGNQKQFRFSNWFPLSAQL